MRLSGASQELRGRRHEKLWRPSAILLAPLLTLCGQVALSQSPIESRPLLLSEAVRYALEHSPSITSAKSAVTSAQAQKLAAVAALLPSLSLTEEPQIFTPLLPPEAALSVASWSRVATVTMPTWPLPT